MIPLRDYRPSGIVPYVTYAILLVNVAVFLYQLVLGTQLSGVRTGRGFLTQGEVFILTYGVVPCKFFQTCAPHSYLSTPIPVWATLLTSMFMHGGWLHIGGNMLYLWIFGDNVEAAMGHGRFLAFYLLAGVAAAWAQVLTGVDSAIPMVGASGAISGVLAAYLFLFPHSRVLTLVFFFYFIRLVELPALFILGVWFALQLFSALGTGAAGGGVAFMAHVGGFVAGALLLFVFKKRGVPVPLIDSRRPY